MPRCKDNDFQKKINSMYLLIDSLVVLLNVYRKLPLTKTFNRRTKKENKNERKRQMLSINNILK